MNELAVIGNCRVYFKTNANNYDDALTEFLMACTNAGIEFYIEDNSELRDADGNVIED